MGRMSPRRQGDLGELSAMEWLGSTGYGVCFPIGHSPDYDLIADDGDVLTRVQVKTSAQYRKRRWEVAICTRGGNQSWNGLSKCFSPARCDRLFVLVGDGRRWFIPATAVEGTTKLLLGGPKYAEFEVEAGRPLPRNAPPVAMLDAPGGVPERSKGIGCKPIGSAFAGSNPAPAMAKIAPASGHLRGAGSDGSDQRPVAIQSLTTVRVCRLLRAARSQPSPPAGTCE